MDYKLLTDKDKIAIANRQIKEMEAQIQAEEQSGDIDTNADQDNRE